MPPLSLPTALVRYVLRKRMPGLRLAAISPPRAALAHQLFEFLRGRVGIAIVAVAHGHFFVGGVALCLCGVPVDPLPFIAQDSLERIAGRERDANAETPLREGFILVHYVMKVTIIHIESFGALRV